MYYYEVVLPIRLDKHYIYTSDETIESGCRVLVQLGNSLHTGIVWQECHPQKNEIEYRDILEVIDQKPKINLELLKLADWLSKYYHCPLGMALSAMLPAAFNVQIRQQVRLLKTPTELNENFNKIISELPEQDWLDIDQLKQKVYLTPSVFNENLELLEDNQIIEIKRTFDEKIKKKVANFIIKQQVSQMPDLTDKQLAAWRIIDEFETALPLRSIADQFSRSILKTLESKNLIRIEPRELAFEEEKNFDKTSEPKEILLTDEQQNVLKKIKDRIIRNDLTPFLLFGITGSGKTEIYIEVIRQIRQQDKSALMLVPEISLTPQMTARFFQAFGEDIAILHSHLNDRQRWQEWKKIKAGRSRIVIGARSAIFAPLENLGVIIVDEEHETTYKQDKTPRYNGRDLAVVRAQIAGCAVILGSATPSLESWHNAQTKKFDLQKLTKRPYSVKLPKVQIIDLRVEKERNVLISPQLRNKIEERLAAKEQVILLQNRRGHSSYVQCVSCGSLFKCPNCDISLNFHSHGQELICHFCGYKSPLPRHCPDCNSYLYQFGAPGTQQIENQLRIIFPQARILRMDSDTATAKESYNSMFDRMRNGHVDILLGTQMIAKGLDFANVTLVGVILADVSLNLPDFRAAERTFQLLTQVAGRSGRGEKAGEVIIQTYNPEHYAIQLAQKQDYTAFADKELNLRAILKYPPSFRLARFVFSHKDEKFLKEQINNVLPIIERFRLNYDPKVLSILGPVAAPMIKLQNQYRYHIIIKADSVSMLSKVINNIKDSLNLSQTIKVVIDSDPYNLM